MCGFSADAWFQDCLVFSIQVKWGYWFLETTPRLYGTRSTCFCVLFVGIVQKRNPDVAGGHLHCTSQLDCAADLHRWLH